MWDLHNPDHTCNAFKLEEKSARSLGRKKVHAKSDFQLVSKELVTSTLSISSFLACLSSAPVRRERAVFALTNLGLSRLLEYVGQYYGEPILRVFDDSSSLEKNLDY